MKSVAVIGASADREKFGNQAVRSFLEKGYTVYPINPKASEIESLPVYRSVKDLPTRPDLVTVYVPPAVVLGLLNEIAEKGCDELWLNPGSESDEVVAQAKQLGLNPIVACSIVGTSRL